MLEEMVFLATYGSFSGTTIGNMLSTWEQAGFFSYLLPFLILFALVFGILVKMKLFQDSKAVNGIIALAVALMALQFDFVPAFFSQLFPWLGVGLTVILGILIILGLFLDPKNNAMNWILFAVGVIIIGIVLFKSAGGMGWAIGGTTWWNSNWQMVAGGIFLIVLVAVVIISSNPKQNQPPLNPILWQPFQH